jgi:hypothetical protein
VIASSPARALTLSSTTAPGNSQFVPVFDSTRGLNGTQASVASGGASLIPLDTGAGGRRGRYAGAIVRYTALCTTQNVTLLLQILTGVGGVAGDWETQGSAGSITVTAGTTAIGEFKPEAADWRVVVQAGATGPATCVVKLTILFAEDYGN